MAISDQNLQGLQLILAEDVLHRTRKLSPPILISTIDTLETLDLLHQVLMDQGFSTYGVSLFPRDAIAGAASYQGVLADLKSHTLENGDAPLSLYIGTAPVQSALQDLVDVVAQLRNPEGGCPWDLEQTPKTLTPYIIEEAYETVEAIQQGEPTAIAEELGDLLLQVVLQAQIASETQTFALTEVIQGITAKLIRRHPHVFGETTVANVAEVRANWDEIKAAEKGKSADQPEQVSEKMTRYTKRLPPIMAGLKLSEKAAAAGLEWQDLAGVWAKFYEELGEFQEALMTGDKDHQVAELGDLLFTLVNVARWCKLDPSQALQLTNRKLIDRVQSIESRVDQPLTAYSFEELENLWKLAKQDLSQQQSA